MPPSNVLAEVYAILIAAARRATAEAARADAPEVMPAEVER
jgi:hypothetical protein